MKELTRAWKAIDAGLRWAFWACLLVSLAMVPLKAMAERWAYGQEVGQFVEGLTTAYLTAFIFFLLTDVRKERELERTALDILHPQVLAVRDFLYYPFEALLRAYVMASEGKIIVWNAFLSRTDAEIRDMYERVFASSPPYLEVAPQQELLKWLNTDRTQLFHAQVANILAAYNLLPHDLSDMMLNIRNQIDNVYGATALISNVSSLVESDGRRDSEIVKLIRQPQIDGLVNLFHLREHLDKFIVDRFATRSTIEDNSSVDLLSLSTEIKLRRERWTGEITSPVSE